MTIPASVQPFWQQFHASVGAAVDARFYEAFHFDDNQSSANQLAELVLGGRKRATAGLLWTFEAQGRLPPDPGALSVLTNWQGKPLCVIETVAVAIVPFAQVSEEFAAAEGEGDGSLRCWRQAHWDYLGRECGRVGRTPSLAMPVVCERFEVIYHGAT